MAQFSNQLLNQIRGQILTTVATSKNRDDLWKLADEIAITLTPLWLANTTAPIVDDTPTDHPMIIVPARKPAELKKTKTFSKKNISPIVDAPIPAQQPTSSCAPNTESAEIAPMWTEWEINWNDYELSEYSNPCTSKSADGTIRHVETELWLISRESGELKTCDAHFANEQELRAYCDPLVQIYKAKPKTEYVDPELEAATKKIRVICREHREKKRMDSFLEYWNLFPNDYKKIAELMGIAVQSVYAYKSTAKSKGLIK